MAAPFLQHYFLDDARWRLFRHRECKPVGWCHRTVRVEFDTDGRRCAVVAGQSNHQLRLANVGERVHQRHDEAVRHPREHYPACADYRLHGVNPDPDTNSRTYHAYRPGTQGGGNKYSASRLEWGDFEPGRRLPQ